MSKHGFGALDGDWASMLCKTQISDMRANSGPYNRIIESSVIYLLISWWGNFKEMYSFHRVSGDSSETLRKLCISTKFSNQEIRWNYGILCSVFCLSSFSKLQIFKKFGIRTFSGSTLKSLIKIVSL